MFPLALLPRMLYHYIMPSQTHAHDHAPGHVHQHAAAHSHAPALTIPRRAAPAASLLRMSLAQRLAIASGLTALIWIAVFWALR